MSHRIDELFSVERLRQSWKLGDPAEEEREKAAPPTEVPGAMAVYEHLRSLIQQRFPGKRSEALDLLMGELQEQLWKRFPPAGDVEVSEADQAALNLAMEALLNQIEDLVEALELSDGNRPGSQDRQKRL